MLRVGLTGGIASGKTAVAERFESRGALVIDTDVVAREVVAPGSAGLAAVVQAFGAAVLDRNGDLDRPALRHRIFTDDAARKRLEQILHPLIRARTLELMRQVEADYVIVAVPLLAETGFSELVDRVLVVDCTPDEQIERLMRRDGVTESDARAALAAQASRETRLALADDVIDNSGALQQLDAQIDELHTRYCQLGRNCPQNEGHAE